MSEDILAGWVPGLFVLKYLHTAIRMGFIK